MKQLLLVVLLAGLAHAACDPALRATTTPRLHLQRPSTKMCDWDIPIQQTFDILDGLTGAVSFPQTWTAYQTFTANPVALGQLYFDLGQVSLTPIDEWTFRLQPFAATITRIECEAYTGTSFDINICAGEDTGDDVCTTLIATLSCTADGGMVTSITNAVVTARQKVTVEITGVSGSVTKGEIYIEGAAS